MFPIRDINPTRSTPLVTYALIATNILVFLFQLVLMAGGASWIVPAFGVVPERMWADPTGEAYTIFTAMFMHGDFMHLLGNMLFLYIFGDNVEDELGHGRYAVFYATAGVAAAAAQVIVDPASPIPMIGASGAIGGVLAAYVVLHPRAPILVLNPIPLLWLIWGFFIVLPAWFFVGYWFLWENVIRGVLLPSSSSVAFYAHIGGFIAGLLLVRPMATGRRRKTIQAWKGWRPPPGPPRRRRSSTGSRRDPWVPPSTGGRWN